MDVYQNLKEALLEFDDEATAEWAQKLVAEGLDPVKGLQVIMDTLREVGDAFGRGDLWLPDLLSAAKAAQAAMPVLEEAIKSSGQEVKVLGTIVLGTVHGDLHSIGKSMVSVMLASQGFKVIDLGTNVSADCFVEAIKDHRPEILAMSALLTTTATEQAKVIKALQEAGLREQVKIMVGGGAITPEFAEGIGADGYGASAPEAVSLARQLIGL